MAWPGWAWQRINTVWVGGAAAFACQSRRGKAIAAPLPLAAGKGYGRRCLLAGGAGDAGRRWRGGPAPDRARLFLFPLSRATLRLLRESRCPCPSEEAASLASPGVLRRMRGPPLPRQANGGRPAVARRDLGCLRLLHCLASLGRWAASDALARGERCQARSPLQNAVKSRRRSRGGEGIWVSRPPWDKRH